VKVAYAYDLSYWGSRDRRDDNSRPDQEKTSETLSQPIAGCSGTYTPVVLAMHEAEIRRIMDSGQL
jgi:hypothetical protein